jgi:hypothetical protein
MIPFCGIAGPLVVENLADPGWFRLGGNQVPHPKRRKHVTAAGVVIIVDNETMLVEAIMLAGDVFNRVPDPFGQDAIFLVLLLRESSRRQRTLDVERAAYGEGE